MQGEIPDFQKEEVTKNLYRHVEHLSAKIGERHLWKNDSLSQAEEYVASVMTSFGYESGARPILATAKASQT